MGGGEREPRAGLRRGAREGTADSLTSAELGLVLGVFFMTVRASVWLTHPTHTTRPPTPPKQAAGEGRYWCDQYVAWSKTGAYLLTYHVQGVALWGGPNFDKVARLAHHGVA